MSYPPGMKLRPITNWPGQSTIQRRPSQFQASFSDTVKLLDRELRLLDPKDPHMPVCVLQIAMREQDFRIDGMPRANAVPSHPGVILNIETRNKPPMSFPCDTFTHWHHNLRAIALTLEALRKVDRYGVTQTGQQYRGWQAIEAKPAGITSATAAIARLAEIAQLSPTSDYDAADTYRQARREAHPDRNNGDQALWDRSRTHRCLPALIRPPRITRTERQPDESSTRRRHDRHRSRRRRSDPLRGRHRPGNRPQPRRCRRLRRHDAIQRTRSRRNR
jgi:hypothetical protein